MKGRKNGKGGSRRPTEDDEMKIKRAETGKEDREVAHKNKSAVISSKLHHDNIHWRYWGANNLLKYRYFDRYFKVFGASVHILSPPRRAMSAACDRGP